MSDKTDPYAKFNFMSPAQEEFFRSPYNEEDVPLEALSDSNESPLPGDSTLDPSSELSAESEKQIALATALQQQATDEPPPMLRKGTLTDPVVGMTTPDRLIEFINQTRRKTIEKIEDDIVNQSTPLMLWKLREFALMGKYTETRAIEIWLNWAAKISSRPKKAETDPGVLKNGALFDATLSNAQVLEAQAKALPPKRRSKNFSTAGDFIGKFKAPAQKAKTGAAPKAKKGDK